MEESRRARQCERCGEGQPHPPTDALSASAVETIHRVVNDSGNLTRAWAEIQIDGRVFPSNAVLGGRFVLRACIVNFRTEAPHIDLLLDVAADLGARLDAEMRPAALAAAG